MDHLQFLGVEDVLQVHRDTIAQDGGLGGVRDVGLLEAAVAMPRQQIDGQYLHDDIAAMAAAYLFHLCANHAFHDGNKRVAVLSTLVFLDVNRFEPAATPRQLEAVVMKVAASRMSKDELIGWMRGRIGGV